MSLISILSPNLVTLQLYGYPLILILNILEGPIITYFAAFAASLGMFNVYYVFVLSLLGNFISDIGFFLLGRFGRKTSLVRSILKPRQGIIKNLKYHFEKNTAISIGMVKLITPLAAAGLIFTGMSNVSLKKFLPIVLLMGIPFTLLFTLTGYYSGIAYNLFSYYLKMGEAAIFIVILIFIGVWFLYKRLLSYFEIRFEERK